MPHYLQSTLPHHLQSTLPPPSPINVPAQPKHVATPPCEPTTEPEEVQDSPSVPEGHDSPSVPEGHDSSSEHDDVTALHHRIHPATVEEEEEIDEEEEVDEEEDVDEEEEVYEDDDVEFDDDGFPFFPTRKRCRDNSRDDSQNEITTEEEDDLNDSNNEPFFIPSSA